MKIKSSSLMQTWLSTYPVTPVQSLSSLLMMILHSFQQTTNSLALLKKE